MSIAWLTSPTGGLAEPSEIAHSESETFGSEQMSARVSLMCPWADRYLVLDNILSWQLEWPYLPGSDIRAMTGGVKPFPGSKPTTDGSGIAYEDAQVDINFQWSKFKSNAPGGGGAIYSESLDPNAEFLTLPYQDFRWGSKTGEAIQKEEAPGRLDIGCDYSVTWNGLQSIPAEALTLIGSVNNGTVRSPSLGLTFLSETLLYNPPKISRTVTYNGTGRFQLVIRLSYRKSGWNQFWRAKTGGYSRIYHKDGQTAYNNFAQASFASILP